MKNRKLANAIRMLSIDAIEEANFGHPSAPIGMADIAEVIWQKHLRHNPKNPNSSNRDRYIQSNGHGPMLLYSIHHLTGYDITINDIHNFRQIHSRTSGHPEYGYTSRVETATGQLGQGIANVASMTMPKNLSRCNHIL